jgi:DNA-binding beta-propeller fold protein YncE
VTDALYRRPLGRVRAPELPSDLALWWNTDGMPLQLRRTNGISLAGRVVLLDFWTYGCINCVHVLPDIAFLEAKYRAAPFTVIGVHSAKFANEKGRDQLTAAIERYGIVHPVVSDAAFALWNQYAVRAWPTFVLIDQKGYVVGMLSGEGQREALDAAIGALLTDSSAPSHTTFAVFLPSAANTLHPLHFPGGILADAQTNRLFIGDTGQHRLIVASLGNGQGTDGTAANYIYIGSGGPGLKDGDFTTAQFHRPHGMALSDDGQTLYVADTDNHAIRAVDFKTKTVTTIAGTGQQARRPLRNGPARETDLNSPWDIVLSPDGETLYVAMAGSHQIIALHLKTSEATVLAGSGGEGRRDGLAENAAFAQPSGITIGYNRLYVADAESSCIRAVQENEGVVETLAGGDLFDFGHRDGDGDTARFQHPLGIVFASHQGGTLFVADTYNHCIRRVNPDTGKTTTLTPLGRSDLLNEPGAITAAGRFLYIADTNHHRICRCDSETGEVETMPLPGLCSPELCFPADIETQREGALL